MKGKERKAVLLFGGNLGTVEATFLKAKLELEKKGRILQESTLYTAKAWQMPEGTPDFLNQVVVYETELSPSDLLKFVLNIEAELGRVRNLDKAFKGYQSRTLDIDILFYDDIVLESEELVIPHPRLQERKFVLEPLYELMPNLMHPKLGKRIIVLLNELN